jgi:L-lactate dehydrogenase complex protein LldG
MTSGAKDGNREQVLGALRKALNVRGEDGARRAIIRGRLENRPRGPIPARGQLAAPGRVSLFMQMAEAVDASTARLRTKEEVLPAIIEFLDRHGLGREIVHGTDPFIAGLDWRDHKGLKHREGPARESDAVSLVKAFTGVAETGTLVMLSGPDNPVTLNFLPPTSIAVVEAGDIVGDYESMWAKLRLALGEAVMPRTVNWVTGPSRTADIGQKLELGAHGPGRLHILVVG